VQWTRRLWGLLWSTRIRATPQCPQAYPKKAALHSATAPCPQPNANAVSASSISPETKK
jgi:hypothetical protein